MLTKQSKLKVVIWILRSSGGLLWLTAVGALYCKLYDKPFLGWDSSKLDTVSAILITLPTLFFWLSGKLKPKTTEAGMSTGLSLTREQRLRRELLTRVRGTWGASGRGMPMDDSRQRSLRRSELSVSEAGLPRNMALVVRNRAKTPLPTGTKVIDVFEKSGNQLLILGGPGAGKTTALLELTQTAISRAEQDSLYPIPCVFNLSSWSKRRGSFEDWLTTELKKKPYDVSAKYARSLIDGEHLFLVLDGLDEVAENRREECIRALERFRQTHEMTYMAVCSRTEHYAGLKARVQISRVVLMPLTRQQIQEYLADVGEQSAGLAEATRRDQDLRDLAQSPLMLHLLMLTYREVPADLIMERLRGRTHISQIFSAYVSRMLEIKHGAGLYTEDQVRRWLAWLASSMDRQSLPLFLIESMQPSLLRNDTVRFLRSVAIVTSLIAYWNILKSLPLIARAMGYNSLPLWMLLVAAAVSFLFGQLSAYIVVSRGIRPAEKLTWSWESARRRIIRGFVLVFIVSLFLWLAAEFDWLNLRLMATWVVLGMSGLGGGTLIARRLRKTMIARGHVNSRALYATVYLGPVGLVLGCAVFIIFELIGNPHPDLLPNIGQAAKNGLIWAGVLLPVNVSLGGMSFRTSRFRLVPNQGIFQSLSNAATVYVLTFVLTLAVFCGIEWAAGHWPPVELRDPLSRTAMHLWAGASGLATLAALTFGGLAVIGHFALRWCLYKQGAVPWQHVRFLNFAVDRALLERLGGGYVFPNRLLQEYFASLELEAAAPGDESGPSDGKRRPRIKKR